METFLIPDEEAWLGVQAICIEAEAGAYDAFLAGLREP